ncbi:hypothetical protein COW36_15895 [bacterium (Candidatus Blackallbacteria) CG17_big_fil_post_rev_8_21_14_2_50_48_46]|uniref:JmjC domain-containing protein n=1 Tax=bacterium (Candidatus Blackallbacteria) CG17_big_fil_post_rev_8_21_14_2_50_48_46 TaxID=2014261 RepID=A0A2M7G2V6_9BACT|nr:MAG: hypothetical protein COW64_09045 [bacterium (Candidatus Blackallbacteria) CG18_big_fil_WC_8_21_14_2_50_49_26]PIW15750.1 MAG: hypothetical protein COW36_15895 [bacterium (Candidatus Blackallbacteria) CG17_big_fil_post_rev_8_21_14_2_50_48_46]PIW48752.1 MAG: hypothetical protein COW20_08360 [bacterium (Candidatus Blackallbacteria) CG13_big_fil_rev_8_21_14_2_50_49_14]
MNAVRRLSVQEFQNEALLMALLRENKPFIVRGFPAQTGAYQLTLELFRNRAIPLFNLLGNSAEPGEIRNYHELVEAFSRLKAKSSKTLNIKAFMQEYQALFSKYILSSEKLDTTQDFNVQFDVDPRSELSRLLVSPVTVPYSQVLQGFTRRSYLNTVVNISRGNGKYFNRSKSIHAHNYDTFTRFGSAGPQTCVYFFPPTYYLRFQTRLVSSNPGIALLIPNIAVLNDSLLEEAWVYQEVLPGDIVYTPPLWFHCFHHQGEYLNIANGEFFWDLHQERLAQILPETFGPDWEKLVTHAQSLPHFQA